MTETNERVTVDFDSQSYYLDGEYWESWDSYGEEMADKINKLLNELNDENKKLRSDRNYWKTLAQSLAKTNGTLKLKDEHIGWKRVDVK